MKQYRGKYSESRLTAVVISKLMGCSKTKTKRILKKIMQTFGYIDEDLIGMAIQEVRNKQDLRRINGKYKEKRR